METNYKGIDYGVISIHNVLQWTNNSEAIYPKPCCPNCGNESIHKAREDFDYIAECGIYHCENGHVWYPMEVTDNRYMCPECEKELQFSHYWIVPQFESHDYHCVDCLHVFGEESIIPDKPNQLHLKRKIKMYKGKYHIEEKHLPSICLCGVRINNNINTKIFNPIKDIIDDNLKCKNCIKLYNKQYKR